MKPNILDSLRMRMVLCVIYSVVCTILIDAIIIFGVFSITNAKYQNEQLINSVTKDIINSSNKSSDNTANESSHNNGYDNSNLNENSNDKEIGKGSIYNDDMITIRPKSVFTNNLLLDLIIIAVFSIIIFMAFYVFFSHSIIEYFREVNRGILRIKNGDLDTDIEVKGNDEISNLAYSINNMRKELYFRIERERELERTRNELITHVAHDLRTPLTSIIGYLGLLQENKDLSNEKKEKYISVAYDKSTRLENLVEDLFDYMRFDKNKLKINFSEINITRFIEQLAEEMYPSVEENRLKMLNTFPKEDIYVLGDSQLLARAFSNLASNAVKYGSDGKQIKMQLIKNNGKVIYSITNYGKIIPQSEIRNIFKQFYRVDESRTTVGTGLGLAITKNIIDMHKGKIYVRSDEEGTVFSVVLNEYIRTDMEARK